MARKCRHKACRSELPSVKRCDTLFKRKGFCDAGCVADHARAKNDQRRAKDAKREKRQHRDNDRPHQWKLTCQAVQGLARLLDKGKPCISCSRPDDGSVQFCGGHYKTKGGNPETALDLRNIHGQCNQYCNQNLSGNIEGSKTTHGYTEGLRARYGDQYLTWINGPHPIRKYSCDDLRAIRKLVNAERRRLERGEGPSRDWRSLDYDDVMQFLE